MVNWEKIDTVLLDMDGTLLDLKFDNHFWQTLVPSRYAERENLSFEQAVSYLAPIFKSQEGLLNWYCLDYWSDKLQLDIADLKVQVQEGISELPSTRPFLQALNESGKRCVLVTNAHTESLRIKMKKTGLIGFFDASVSAHDLGYPKENQGFWQAFHALEKFNPKKTLMVDDSLSVLQAADTFGVEYLVAITQPDSSEPTRIVHDFTAVEDLSKIMPG